MTGTRHVESAILKVCLVNFEKLAIGRKKDAKASKIDEEKVALRPEIAQRPLEKPIFN
jgi:hypothetical protein